MSMNQTLLILIFAAVMTGVVSAAYLYETVGGMLNLLKKPLRTIATGMFVMAVGVLLAAFISYESSLGVELAFNGMPLSAYFYVLYIIGSLFILVGSRGLGSRIPKKTVDVSLGE